MEIYSLGGRFHRGHSAAVVDSPAQETICIGGFRRGPDGGLTLIADAILDDDAPLRVGCDDLSEGMLKGWRGAASDEAWLRPMLAGFLEES